MEEVYVVLNNVSSPQRLIDVARVVYAFKSSKVKGFAISKASGMAAQTGIPEVSRMAYKLRKSILILPSINDVIEIVKPDRVLMLVATDDAIDIGLVDLRGVKRLVVVAGGSDDAFTKAELALGEHIYIRSFSELPPPAAAVAVALCTLLKGAER